MKKFLLKTVSKWFLPGLKEKALEYVQCEDLQATLVKRINAKMDIPQLSEEVEAKLLDAAYDAVQEIAKENIDKIDIEKILEIV